MNATRLAAIMERYSQLRIGVVGDFCLDRYLEIDPAKEEKSLETGLPVHNVIHVRSEPGAAGTIVNNLAALGVGTIEVVGFCGEDGEGHELEETLRLRPGVSLEGFLRTPLRRTFVYCKPLLVEAGQCPRELNRLDIKNWTPTPETLQHALASRVRSLADRVDALVLMDQAEQAETGVVTRLVCEAARDALRERPGLLVLADSRRGVRHLPLALKMNAAEFAALIPAHTLQDLGEIKQWVAGLASRNGQAVFVTLGERGMVGALGDGQAEYVPAHAVRGPIDIVGAGDAVTANLAAALPAGAGLVEGMELAMAAASVVIHRLGETGTANREDIAGLIHETQLD